jgi:hypothetical protein
MAVVWALKVIVPSVCRTALLRVVEAVPCPLASTTGPMEAVLTAALVDAVIAPVFVFTKI